jgi:hypothetical protein
MLQQILAHTPVYVWAILAFLVYRGFAASKGREATIGKLAIIPVVMIGLALQGLVGVFGMAAVPLSAWLAGVLVGLAMGMQLVDGSRVTVNLERGTVIQPGSWVPLMLMMAIFATKYAVAVMLAMQPALRGELFFAVAVSALYGLFNGVFLARLLPCVFASRRLAVR